MNTKNILVIIMVILLALTFIGCIGVDSDFREVKSLVIKSTNDKFYKDVEFSVGSVGIAFVRMIASFNDDDDDAQAILRNISQVQVGVYKRSKYKSGFLFHIRRRAFTFSRLEIFETKESFNFLEA